MDSPEVITERHSAVMAEVWLKCDKFNKNCPVGTSVCYIGDEQRKETKTRSEAWALPSGDAVVMIDGKSSGVSLDHIVAI